MENAIRQYESEADRHENDDLHCASNDLRIWRVLLDALPVEGKIILD